MLTQGNDVLSGLIESWLVVSLTYDSVCDAHRAFLAKVAQKKSFPVQCLKVILAVIQLFEQSVLAELITGLIRVDTLEVVCKFSRCAIALNTFLLGATHKRTKVTVLSDKQSAEISNLCKWLNEFISELQLNLLQNVAVDLISFIDDSKSSNIKLAGVRSVHICLKLRLHWRWTIIDDYVKDFTTREDSCFKRYGKQL